MLAGLRPSDCCDLRVSRRGNVFAVSVVAFYRHVTTACVPRCCIGPGAGHVRAGRPGVTGPGTVRSRKRLLGPRVERCDAWTRSEWSRALRGDRSFRVHRQQRPGRGPSEDMEQGGTSLPRGSESGHAGWLVSPELNLADCGIRKPRFGCCCGNTAYRVHIHARVDAFHR